MGVITTATALTAAGLAVSAGSAGMSFAQAGKQRKLQREAEADAEKAMAEARKKLDVNFYEQLAIQKEPYELAREAALVQGAEALQAGVEGEQRGAGAVAGRIQMAQNQQQADIRSAMGQEMMALEQARVAEESRLRDMGVRLDLAEATGAQLAARDAQQAAAAATTQGVQGIQSVGKQLVEIAPLYDKTQGARIAGRIDKTGKKLGLSQSDIQKSISSLGTVDGVDLSGVASMKPYEAQDFMQSIAPKTLKQIESLLPNIYSSPNRPTGFGLPKPNYGLGFPYLNLPAVGGG
jgi:hypothetical protein